MNNLTKILEAKKARDGASDVEKKEDDNKAGTEEKVPAGGKTMTDQRHNKIELNPVIGPLREESAGKHAVATFGRMNPPTIGHQKLVDHVKKLASDKGADAHVFLSHSHDSKKNPLEYNHKLKLAKHAFGDSVKHIPKEHAHLLGVAKHLDGKADHLHVVVGSDRVEEAKKKLSAYNGKDYHYKSITVHSAGERDPDASDASGMSASKMRQHAKDGNHAAFKSGLPENLRGKSKEIMHATSGKGTIGEQIAESLNPQQRMKRAIQFRRIKNRVAMGRARALRRRAPRDALVKRSRRLAIKFMRARVIRGQNYGDLPYATRALVDSKLKKRKKSIKRIAQRLLPRVAKAEASRKLGGRFTGVNTRHMSEENLLTVVESMLSHLVEDYDYELTEKEQLSLYNKAQERDIPVDVLESVFRRGLAAWQSDDATELSFQSYAFNRVNSFLAGGAALELDEDLLEDCGEIASVVAPPLKPKSVEHRTTQRPTAHNKKIVQNVLEGNVRKSTGEKLQNRLNKLDPARAQRQKDLALIVAKYKKADKAPITEDALSGEKRRVDMPQLTNFDAFHKDLTDSGHQLGHDFVKPDTLQPMQKHFNQEKVDKLKQQGWGDKGIIVSKDNYVIDGHHRWVAASQLGSKIRARVASLKADELLDFVKDKPYVEKKKLDESNDSVEGESHLEIEFDEKGVHKVTHIKGAKLEESGSDPLADHEFHKVLSKFKPSKLDHDTIQKELHHHLAKHGLYSHSDRHPLIRNPAENKHLVDWSRVTAHKEAKHVGWHSDTTGNPETTKGNHHVAVWSTQHPTHIRDAELGKHGHDDNGRPKQRPGGTKPEHGGGKIEHPDGHVVVFNDVRAQHKASDNKDSHDRWFARIHNVRKIPEKGFTIPSEKGETHFGKDIHSYVAAKKATRGRPKEAVTGWLAKNGKHKSYDKAVEHAKKNGLYDEKAIADKKKKLGINEDYVVEGTDPHSAILKRAMGHYEAAGQISDHHSSEYHHHMANHHDLMGQYSAAHGKLQKAEMHYNNAQRHVRQGFGLSK